MARTARKNNIPHLRSIAGGILSDPMFRKRVEPKKVGRASYTRKVKHRSRDY
jgi:stalled ribosome alternative rescue factor ArfA